MGKAKRTKQNDELRLDIQSKKDAENEKKAKARNKRIVAIVATVLALAIVGGLVSVAVLNRKGFFLRRTVSISSEHYEVNNAMLSYFYNVTYTELYTANYSYFVLLGYDAQASAKSQLYYNSTTQTWFDYFMNQTYASVRDALIHCEAALAAGVKLEDADYAEIDEDIEALKKAAKEAGSTVAYYVSSNFGSGVTVNDIRDCMEIIKLYNKYYTQLSESYKYSSTDYSKYYSEHEKEMKYVDYLTYTLKASTLDTNNKNDASAAGESTDNLEKADLDDLRPYAEAIAAATNADEFKAAVRNYITEVVYKGQTIHDPESEEGKKDGAITTTTVDDLVDACLKEDTSYVEDNKVSEWLYGSDVAANSVKTFEDSGTDASSPVYTIEVAMLITPPARHEYLTRDVRHILLTSTTYGSDDAAQTKANEVLEEFKGGAMTADDFDKLAQTYNEDSSSLYEDVLKGRMVSEFNDWLFDEARKVGDSEVVKTTYGYHIMYYAGEGMTAWEKEADDALKTDAYNADLAAMKAAHKITYDTKAMYEIPA